MTADFAFAVRSIRQASGLTQASLASRASMPREWITKIEGYNQLPTINSIYKLAAALGVSAYTLVSFATANRKD
jgi:transcriptional regulator with XRE-family HTH domain